MEVPEEDAPDLDHVDEPPVSDCAVNEGAAPKAQTDSELSTDGADSEFSTDVGIQNFLRALQIQRKLRPNGPVPVEVQQQR